MKGSLHNRIVVSDFFSKLVETLPQRISRVNIPILPNGGKTSNEKSGTCTKPGKSTPRPKIKTKLFTLTYSSKGECHVKTNQHKEHPIAVQPDDDRGACSGDRQPAIAATSSAQTTTLRSLADARGFLIARQPTPPCCKPMRPMPMSLRQSTT